MNLTRTLFSIVSLGAAGLALAQPLNYSAVTVEVKAGVVVLPGQQVLPGVAANPSPHVWFNIDQDNTVKPAKWTFVNPVGASVLTSGVRNRWLNIDAATPALGTRLTKATAPYWEVPIDTISDEALARYDVLSLSINQSLTLNPAERDKLRRYMDQGGVLWVDLVDDPAANIQIDAVNPLPFPFTWMGSLGSLDANLFHPLMRFPNPLSLNDLALTEYWDTVNKVVTNPFANIFGQMEPFEKWIVTDSAGLQPVAGTVDGSTVSVGKIGQGFMVLTSRGVTANLNRGLPFIGANNYVVNRGFYGLKVPADSAFTAAAKLAINLISLGGVSTTRDSGPHHTSSNFVDLTAPLLRTFKDDQGLPGFPFDIDQQPALYKGRVIVCKGNQIFVYDSRPGRDLDGDGNPDDGMVNPIGSQSDLVWVSAPTLGGKISAPTIIEAPNTTLFDGNRPGGPRATDQIWVTDDQSHVYIFDLDSDGAAVGLLNAWPPLTTATGNHIDPPVGTVAGSGGPFAPTVQESLAFITDTANINGQTGGRVWAIDVNEARLATSSGGDWDITASARFPEPSAPVSIAYIPIQDGSGGLDRVAYVATKPSGGLNPRPAGITSIFIGSRAESPIRVEYDSAMQVLTLTTRCSYYGLPILLDHTSLTSLDSLGLKISIIDSSGNPLPTATMNQILGTASTPAQATNGVLVVQNVTQPVGIDLDGKQTPSTADDVGFRLDYTVEWAKAGTGAFQPPFENYVRGNLELPDDNRNTREVIGSPAVAPNGTVYVVTSFKSGNDPGGTLFGLKENKGPGQFTMTSRFEVYDALTFNLNSSTGASDTISMAPVLTDEDQLVQILPFLNAPVSGWRFTSGPTVRGDSVYVMAEGFKNIFGQVPMGTLLSFRTDAGTPSFTMAGRDTNFTIVQADPALSLIKNAPEQYSVLQPGQFTVEPIPGTQNSRVVLNSLMNVTRGRVRDSINVSLPIIIRRGGQTDTLIEPEAIADNGRFIAGLAQGRWNPLSWYMMFNGFKPGAGPVVAGQTLYQGGSSVLPSLLSGAGLTFKGLVFALDATISPNDEFLKPNSVRPWTQQLNGFLSATNSFSDIRPASAIKWPQFKGIQDQDDLRIRILQAAIEEDGVRTLSAGDETLAITGPSTLFAFSRSDFLVVDAGRISRIDPAGNPLWTTDQTLVAGKVEPTTSFGAAKQLSEPNRMYSTGDNGYWIVDTGNNRVVRVDGAAREIRTVEKLKVDPNFRPDGINDQGSAAGMTAGETLSLKRPKDVLVYDTLVDSSVVGANPFSNPRPLERWTHMLIADSGNNRVVEVVDRYEVNPTTGRTVGVVQYQDPPASGKFVSAMGVIYWHTPEELTGKDYRYNSIARTIQDVAGVRHTIIGFGFGNVEPGIASLGLDTTNQNTDRTSGFGGVVLYDGPTSIVIREFQRPAINMNTFIAENPPGSGSFDYSWPQINQPARTQKLVGLNSVTVRYVDYNGSLALAVMVADATGVYELVQDTAQLTKPWVVRWMLPIEAYVGMRHPRGGAPFNLAGLGQNPNSFRPMFAQRLDSGEVLVVNGYVGRRRDNTEFQGEVILVDGSFADASTQVEDPGYDLGRANIGFNRLSVKFEIPPVQGVRGIVAPVFAHRQ